MITNSQIRPTTLQQIFENSCKRSCTLLFIELVNESTNGVNVFVVDQAPQAYDIYLIIYVCVGTTEAGARGHT